MPVVDSADVRPREPVLLRALQQLELDLRLLVHATRLLPAMTARNARQERLRLVRQVTAGRPAEPRWQLAPPPSVDAELQRVSRLLRQVEGLPCQALYEPRLLELELELCLLANLGRPKQLRPLSARRFGTGSELVKAGGQVVPLSRLARRILARVPSDTEPRVVPARGTRSRGSLTELMRRYADAAGLSVRIVVDPSLVAGAATGDRTVYLADRLFGAREAERLAVHEVFGHLTAAANGRAQPIRILEWGTADSFADQEGLALYLEDRAGLLDRHRLRVLAARVIAADAMHDHASFTETATLLHRDEGFAVEDAVAITERAYRGGGIARDVAYLIGFLRVCEAVDGGVTDIDTLRSGRLSLSALPHVACLKQLGLARAAAYRPNFSRSLCSTNGGTTPRRLPPRAAASLIKVELT